MIAEIVNPLERYFAFITERNEIYHKKINRQPWPWTKDPILQEFRFTEIYRERDRTSLHYQKTVRDYYKEDCLVLPATVLYRWYNRMSTCEALFSEPNLSNQSPFERYINTNCEKAGIFYNLINNLPTPHVTGAFIINGATGYEKGIGVAVHFHEWCQKPWREQWVQWLDHPPTLQDMFLWLRKDATGLGSFMGAQLVADLKYLPFMKNVEDWWTWASPGPGSMKGLNAVLDRPMHQSWKPTDWLENIQQLNKLENTVISAELEPFHCQDTQNHCCEFSKYEKVRLGIGRPRQVYRHV